MQRKRSEPRLCSLFLAVPFFSFLDTYWKHIKHALMLLNICMKGWRSKGAVVILVVEAVRDLTCFLLLEVIDSHVPLETFTIIWYLCDITHLRMNMYVVLQTHSRHSVLRLWASLVFVWVFSWHSPAYFTSYTVCSSCLYSAWNLISFGLPAPSGQGKIFHSLNIFFCLLLCHCRIL